MAVYHRHRVQATREASPEMDEIGTAAKDAAIEAWKVISDDHLGGDRFQEAIQALQQAMELDPKNGVLRDKLQRAQIALKQSKRKNYVRLPPSSPGRFRCSVPLDYALGIVTWALHLSSFFLCVYIYPLSSIRSSKCPARRTSGRSKRRTGALHCSGTQTRHPTTTSGKSMK